MRNAMFMKFKRYLACLLAGVAAFGVAGQSVYPGQHEGRLAVEMKGDVKAYAFDLRDVRLLPGRVRDNLERDSAWLLPAYAQRNIQGLQHAGAFVLVLRGQRLREPRQICRSDILPRRQ